MAQQQQEDGYYPRLNAEMLNSGQHSGMIVSVIGTVEACDGQYATVKCADGGQARFLVDPAFAQAPGSGIVLELIGAAMENQEVQVGVSHFELVGMRMMLLQLVLAHHVF